MQSNAELLDEFEEAFQKIYAGEEAPRPGLFGYTRVARQVHKLEVAVTYLIRQQYPRFPLPSEPETAYERWLEQRDEDDLGAVFGDIYQANPRLFNSGSAN